MDDNKSKKYKSRDDSSFNTWDSREGTMILNSTSGEEDEVREILPSRPVGREQAKRKGKAMTSSASSAAGVDVEALTRLMGQRVCNDQRPVQRPKGPEPYRVIADEKDIAVTQG
ncbi:hypothetical protein Tco_0618520 [Tanacetum coccineum]